jgi:hypothetical protein
MPAIVIPPIVRTQPVMPPPASGPVIVPPPPPPIIAPPPAPVVLPTIPRFVAPLLPPPPAPAPIPAPFSTYDTSLEADIRKWQSEKDKLAKAKAEETRLRERIAKRVFTPLPTGYFPEGTNNAIKADESGTQWKVSLKQNYKREVLEESETQTKLQLSQMGVPDDLISGLIKRNPELSKSTYNKLNEDQQAVADHMLTLKPAHIELEITELPKQ